MRNSRNEWKCLMVELMERIESNQSAREELESAVVRFAGDSGDGIQLTGSHFTLATAIAGNDLATFPDFPAEIRAPVGTTFGVSAFQINFGARRIRTIGDRPDVLVAFNPAALKVSLGELRSGGVLIVDSGSFNARNLAKAGYENNPLEDGSLEGYRVISLDISSLTKEATATSGLKSRDQLRCKNFYALGLVYWMFARARKPTVDWINAKFGENTPTAIANIAALNAAHSLAETAEFDAPAFAVPHAPIPQGLYRTITGHEALAFGLVDGSIKAGVPLTFCSYPITPASALLHHLAKLKDFGVRTFQAEDEIAAACSAIGASYTGHIGVTSSSGPGIALKTEAIGLAVATELPLVIVNAQRAGPSTGMPTKTEQSDLYQAVYGRNADTPVVVLAAARPSECFELAREAVRIATRYMTPVMLLTDGFLANASEPWLIPDASEADDFPVEFRSDVEGYQPFARNDDGARAWAKPGTPGLMHRIGGIERDALSGNISYDPENHQAMTDARWQKILNVADTTPEQKIEMGEATGKLAIVGWGSTYGPIARAVTLAREKGQDVSHIHLRNIWPLANNLKELLGGFDKILVPEMNKGQLWTLLRSEFLIDAEKLTKVTGKPFTIEEMTGAIDRIIDGVES